MTPRERWVVYPLLFFALSLALKPKLLQEIDTKRLRCESLTIAKTGVDLWKPHHPPHQGGSVEVYGVHGQLAATITAGDDGKAGQIRTFVEGRPQMTLNLGPDDTFVDIHQTSARPANGIIYGVDALGQRLPLALVGPGGRPSLPDDIRRRIMSNPRESSKE
jgi:hypothetical protein